jgi:hypothetical protein
MLLAKGGICRHRGNARGEHVISSRIRKKDLKLTGKVGIELCD